ncbi:hypothetical protein ACIQ9E_16025 [Streptomyces sp. NPDC094448]|uniref:DUF7848 domain-containing protein n=1 Tax=Streptomyces sp. NPDC094448 TaxID=3366063 RepID=UPI0038110052
MTRAVHRHALWRLLPDPEPMMYEMHCRSRPGRVRGEPRAAVEQWALEHTGREPLHREFVGRIPLALRVVPAPGNPLYGQDAELPGPDADPGRATVTALPLPMACVVCCRTDGVEEAAAIPRGTGGQDRQLYGCPDHADAISTRALQELEDVEAELGVGRR